MPKDNVEVFLQAEAEAHQLVEQLVKLKRETESYAAAHTELEKAGGALGELSGVLGGVTQRLGEVVQTLRSIGTPELLRAQEASTVQLEALSSRVVSLIDTARKLHDDLSARVQGQEVAAQAARDDLRAQLERHSSETQAVQAELARLRRQLFWGTGILLLAIGIAAAISMLARG